MIQTHINTDNTDFTYQNTTEVGQNIFFTGTGGAGNINTSTYDSGNTRYFHAGSAGVSLQVFINDSLVESISGGSGNIVSIADVKKHTRTENHRYTVSCGFLGLKRCWRDNWVQIWEWGHNRRNATHRAEGQTKSFVLNIPPQSTLKVKFIGSSDSEYKGSVSISLLENTQGIPFKPIDLGGLEGLVEPEIPEVEVPSPEVQEPLPEVDSNENTEQGGESSQENTESENTENENPPVLEPETEQENETTPPEVEAPQEPQTQEAKLARIQEIKQNALVSEFLSVKKTFTDFHQMVRQDQNNNATPTTPEQIQAEKNNQLIFDWFMSWLIDPTHTAELEDMPQSQNIMGDSSEAVNQALAKWVLKIPNLNEICADLQGKGMSYTLEEFKIMLVCFFDSVNQYKDSFENERNRYVEIYAMPEIRALIDELEKLEAEV